MDEDWDLFAVVRGYKSATSNATTETPPTTTNTASSEDTLSCLATLTFKEENDPFSFPNLEQPRTHGFQELQRVIIPSVPSTTTTTATSGFGINPNSTFPDFPATTFSSIRPHFVAEAFHDQQQPQQQLQQNQLQVVHKQEFQITQSSTSAMTLPNTQAQTPRSRKRKIQQKRMVCHVTAENLSADLWAWRKYGQKPIKGSPYPRNYYRCSSSKGCLARKQVERSITEPDMFIVTYTGDHTHPRPTHRNSLAGSTRNKPSTTHISRTQGSGSPSNPGNVASSSSPFSSSSLSPTTALASPPENEDDADEPITTHETQSPTRDLHTQVASDDDILIPNTAVMEEDIFLGLHQFGDGGNSCDGSSPDSQPELIPAGNDNFSDNSRPNPG